MSEHKGVESAIEEQVSSYISEDDSLFIVDVALRGAFGNQKLQILLDGDQGVSIDTCVSVSRRLSAFLEENDLIEGKYHLEVSSAGIDQPLKLERQYHKNVGRSLALKLIDGEKIEGKLIAVSEKELTLEVSEKKSTKEILTSFENIASAKVLVSFK